MKCSEALRILKKDGWYIVSQKGSHMKMRHPSKSGTLIFPNHGSQELAKGLQLKLFKKAQISWKKWPFWSSPLPYSWRKQRPDIPQTLTCSRKERKGAAIKGNLDWRTITAVKMTLNLLADWARAPGRLRYTADGRLVAIDTPVWTSFVRDKDGDN